MKKMNKVYCNDCKNHWVYDLCFIGEYEDTPYKRRRFFHNTSWKNYNNECIDYTPTYFKRFKVWLSKTFMD